MDWKAEWTTGRVPRYDSLCLPNSPDANGACRQLCTGVIDSYIPFTPPTSVEMLNGRI